MDESPTGFGIKVEIPTTTNQGETISTPGPSLKEVRATLPEKATATVGDGEHQETRGDIPIRIVRIESKNLGKCDTTQDQDAYAYTDVPGGVPLEIPNSDGTYDIGSIAAPFNHGSWGEGWTTAGHLGPVGEDVYQPDHHNGGVIATIKDKFDPSLHPLKDCSFAKDNSSAVPFRKIANEKADGGYDFYLKGIVTETTLNNDVGTDKLYYSQGTFSGRKSGTISGTTTWGVKSTHDTSDGDSGGPLFSPNFDDAFIAGQIVRSRGSYDDDNDTCRDDLGSVKGVKVESLFNGHYMTTDDTPI